MFADGRDESVPYAYGMYAADCPRTPMFIHVHTIFIHVHPHLRHVHPL
ncbi:hypothetical protein [Prevotella pallens]|nr:hypothetical protein [Prevotella pallens]